MSITRKGETEMVQWWWIPASFGIALIGGAFIFFLLNLGSFFRYLRISSM